MACTFLNILPRDGTSQADRLLEALKDTYVQIEERTPAEWHELAKNLSAEINFYDLQNNIDKNWLDFFNLDPDNIIDPWIKKFGDWMALSESQQDMPLHLALFIAFLRLLEILKSDLNTLTNRHLDFYYRDILGFRPNSAEPDLVHVLFELAGNTEQHLLKAGTQLKAGKDAGGKNLLYEVEKDTVLNRAGVRSLRTVYLDKQNQSRIFMAPVADSADGLGKDQGKDGVYWSPFGESQEHLPPERKTMTEASVGWAVASPVLLMKEGERRVKLTIELKSYSLTQANINHLTGVFGLPLDYVSDLMEMTGTDYENDLNFRNALIKKLTHHKSSLSLSDFAFDSHINQIMTEVNAPLRHLISPDLEDIFKASASGEKDWASASVVEAYKSGENKIVFDIQFNPGRPAIVPYNRQKLSGLFDSAFPVLRIFLDNSAPDFLYPELRRFQLVATRIEVEVSGVQDLVLQNDSDVLDASGSFLPFGAMPVVGSSFYIGSLEVFSKQLEELKIDLEWDGLPAVDFSDHYATYTQPVNNSTFVANVRWLDGRGWLPGNHNIHLFNGTNNAQNPGQTLNLDNLVPYDDSRAYDLDAFDRLEVLQKRGFIRFDLQDDFRHKDFPDLYVEKAILKATTISTQLPNPPYTPKIKKISLSDKSSATMMPGQDNFPETFFHIEAFGSRLASPSNNSYLLPQYAWGTLYIGLENLQPPQNLSMLFQVLEGSGDPDYTITRQQVRWSVLSGSRWLPLSSLEILEDATLGLQTSGILALSVWREASKNGHTLLPEGSHWLKAEVDINPIAAAKMIAVKAQAARAVFIDRANDPAHYGASLPAETIHKMTESVGAVKKVAQPFVSFGGARGEGQQDFYVRVSERLRHKQRSITLWDYEHMVLKAFPELYKVKCINHYYDDLEIMPGKVTVALIPDLRQKNGIDPLKPRASSALRSRVYDYLSRYVSPFVELKVENAEYEVIQLDFQVRFYEGYDSGFYAKQLNDEIVRFLSPWAFEEGKDIVFGGQIYKSILLNFIEERPYVDFVTNFTLMHFRKGIGSECINGNFIIGPIVDIALATTPRSILVSAAQHTIKVLQPGAYPCTGAVVSGGVGEMIIDFTFEIA